MKVCVLALVLNNMPVGPVSFLSFGLTSSMQLTKLLLISLFLSSIRLIKLCLSLFLPLQPFSFAFRANSMMSGYQVAGEIRCLYLGFIWVLSALIQVMLFVLKDETS